MIAAGTPEEVVLQMQEARKAKQPFSQTAPFIETVLAAGPLEYRPIFDPKTLTEKRENDVDLEKVGKDALLPGRWMVESGILRTG